MTNRRIHPDTTDLLEQFGCGSGPIARAVREHSRACVACTGTLADLVQIAVALFDDLPPCEMTPASRTRALDALGLTPPRSTPAPARATSAARAGSG